MSNLLQAIALAAAGEYAIAAFFPVTEYGWNTTIQSGTQVKYRIAWT